VTINKPISFKSGDVNGWCKESHLLFSSFHSTSGKSVTHSGLHLELSIKFSNKSFDPKILKNMDDEEAILYLSSLRQIGRWSAEMILLFTLNRKNIWPVQDIGLLRAISNNYNKKYLPPKKFVNYLKLKFTPYCSVATWYLWRSIDDEPIQY